VWEWYAWRRGKASAARPNAGHIALAELERHCGESGRDFLLVTQNVDGLHGSAGSARLVELHGNIGRIKCFERGHPALTWPNDGKVPPACAECGSPLRPDVVWFGEAPPSQALEAAMRASSRCDVFLCVGTSALVEPAASLPWIALEHGAVLVEVNPEPTPLTPAATIALRGRAGELLPQIVK
jgi:NAD-dependent deacetylase